MPIKAHVKGKRKAPPPPTPPVGSFDAANSNINVQSSINQRENKFPNGKSGSAPETMTCFTTVQKRKKAAPLPPSIAVDNKLANCAVNKEKHATANDEMNNLSAISKRFSDKSAVKAINLNIFEPNHIRNHFQCATKETNEVNVNLDSDANRRRSNLFENDDYFRRERKNDQVWICNYCTLQNPFWKIICDACERIKPYNMPTINSNVNLAFVAVANVDGNDSARVNEKNMKSTVMMRPKSIKPNNNDVDKILNRSSMNVVDIKSASSSKEMPKKRNSLCVFNYGDQNISSEALEMEKERIRSVIRAMNNRALALKCPDKAEKKIDEMKNDLTTKTATINKPGKRRNGLLKYDIGRDYNFPSIRQTNNITIEEHSTKANASNGSNTNNVPRPIKKIENIDSIAKCNKLLEHKQTYCDNDDATHVNTRKKLEHDSTSQRHENQTTTASKNSINADTANEIL